MSGLVADVGLGRGPLDLSVSTAIAPGERAALLGPNGAGKTTFLELISGITGIERGTITLGGKTLDDPLQGVFVPPEQRRIGVVFQDHLLFPHLSALDNVGFGVRASGRSREATIVRAMTWLDRLGVAGAAGQRPSSLSGGQAQRVALARALAIEPDLLLLDEPLASLDVSTRREMRGVLADHLTTFAGPVLMVTHSAATAFLLADVVYVIEKGQIVQGGTPDQIRLRPQTPYVADLAGLNLFRGTLAAGIFLVDGFELRVAVHGAAGPAIATIHPRAVAVHRHRPKGSPRNVWETRVARVEHLGERVRLQFESPLPITAEITPASLESLGVGPDTGVWLAVKATEIGLDPA